MKKGGQGIRRSLKLGISTIHYELILSRRRSIGIIVGRDGQVTVRAPKRLSKIEIDRIVAKKAGWIQRKLSDVESLPPMAPPPQYVAGELHYYLGQQFALDVNQGSHKAVRIENGRLLVTVRDKNSRRQIERKLSTWYRAQARRVYTERSERLFQLIEPYGVAMPEIKIRKMKRRWGSCHPGGHITLNLRLVQTPLPCIDYVIIHELCHLVEPNHGRRFYALLEKLLPNWRSRRDRLNQLPIS